MQKSGKMKVTKIYLLLVVGYLISFADGQNEEQDPTPAPVSPGPASATTTTSPAPKILPPEPVELQCQNITMEFPNWVYLPSDRVEINCTCYGDIEKHGACPSIAVDSELWPLIDVDMDSLVEGNDCITRWTVNAKGQLFKRRRFDLQVRCNYTNIKAEDKTLSFKKSLDEEGCKLTTDCWSEDQQCRDGKCACFDELPAFVPIENKCYPAAGYGAVCKFNEQCQNLDSNTECKNDVCSCVDKYSKPDTGQCQIPVELQCQNITMELPNYVHLPSDRVEFNCTCYGDTKKHGACPSIAVDRELLPLIDVDMDSLEEGNDCITRWTVNAKGELFKRRWLDLQVRCNYNNIKAEDKTLSFKKSLDKEGCKFTTDCWSEDQQCQNGKCACFVDLPAFVPSENKCYRDAVYGAVCKFNEQCQKRDNYTECKNEVCSCVDKYSEADTGKCQIPGSDSSSLSPHQTIIFGTLILSAFTSYLRK